MPRQPSSPDRSLTHLQRAFKVFEALRPSPLSVAHLAEVMATTHKCAKRYVERLKAHGCIECYAPRTRYPMYSLVAGAQMPPDDRRGGARRRR